MNLNQLSNNIHQDNVAKGFYDDFRMLVSASEENHPNLTKALKQIFDAQRIALIQSEASEALEANRKDRKADVLSFLEETTRQPYEKEKNMDFVEGFEKYIKDTEEDEIADTLIRIFDYAGFKGIDLEFHVNKKLEYNRTRPYKHGKSM